MSSLVAALDLQSAVERFCALDGEASTVRPTELYHAALTHIHEICSSVLRCESAGMERSAIVGLLEPARDIHARSPFVRRLQEWPRGYRGDFETVDYICRGTNDAPSGTLEHVCQSYSLNFPIAQQHRNKVQQQAAHILKAMMEKPRENRILSLACGSAPDFELIAPHLDAFAGDVWFNDADEDALARAEQVVERVASRCHFVHGDVMRMVPHIPGTFDLVLAGGLFDYLPERAATFLIRTVYRRLLREGGTFFFTNIARDNPFRCLIEYIGDWFLIERSENDILELCRIARIPREQITMRRDETGLAILIEISKECEATAL